MTLHQILAQCLLFLGFLVSWTILAILNYSEGLFPVLSWPFTFALQNQNREPPSGSESGSGAASEPGDQPVRRELASPRPDLHSPPSTPTRLPPALPAAGPGHEAPAKTQQGRAGRGEEGCFTSRSTLQKLQLSWKNVASGSGVQLSLCWSFYRPRCTKSVFEGSFFNFYKPVQWIPEKPGNEPFSRPDLSWKCQFVPEIRLVWATVWSPMPPVVGH